MFVVRKLREAGRVKVGTGGTRAGPYESVAPKPSAPAHNPGLSKPYEPEPVRFQRAHEAPPVSVDADARDHLKDSLQRPVRTGGSASKILLKGSAKYGRQ